MKKKVTVHPKLVKRSPVKAAFSPYGNIPMLALNAIDDISTLAGALQASGDTAGVQYLETVMKNLEKIASNY